MSTIPNLKIILTLANQISGAIHFLYRHPPSVRNSLYWL